MKDNDNVFFPPEPGRQSLPGVGLEDLSMLVPSARHEDLPDLHLGAPRMPVTDQHLVSCPHQPFLSSASGDVYGYGIPQAPRYQQFMPTPQSPHAGQFDTVCPTPTYSPSVFPLLTCDHTNCYPPFDVKFLSRRFPENELWTRARALAVASLPFRRRGSESFETSSKATRDSES